MLGVKRDFSGPTTDSRLHAFHSGSRPTTRPLPSFENNWSSSIGMYNWSRYVAGLKDWCNNWFNIMCRAVHNRLTLMGDRSGNALHHSAYFGQHGLVDSNGSDGSRVHHWMRGNVAWSSSSYSEESRQHHLKCRKISIILFFYRYHISIVCDHLPT